MGEASNEMHKLSKLFISKFLSNSICSHHNHYHHHSRDIDTVYTLGPGRDGEIEKTTVKEIEILGRGGEVGAIGRFLVMIVVVRCRRR